MSQQINASNLPTGGGFRNRLRSAFAEKTARNPRYSLRAFANYLDIDHATLSQLLRGQRVLTEATVRRLGARIGLTAQEIEECVRCLPFESMPSSEELREIAADALQVLSDWTAFALLELMRVKEFRADVGWIAHMFGCEPKRVQLTLQSLLRLGMLQMKSSTEWVDRTGGEVFQPADLSRAVLDQLATRCHEAKLASARNATEGLRAHGSVVAAVGPEAAARLVALASQSLADARRATEGEPVDQPALYHFEVHCYPVTQPIPLPPKGDTLE
ncbi:MAG: DUF4423 domain-containing protein [Betaproteobacteria bacterium]|nr:DUF4423 domain-containing protein [Betaproteobacteria bacterium]